MKVGMMDVLDVSVFDENGKLITTLDTLRESKLSIGEQSSLFIRDALLDLELLKFVHCRDSLEKVSEYDLLESVHKPLSITFNTESFKNFKNCKLIGRCRVRNSHTNKDEMFLFKVPFARVNSPLVLEGDIERPSVFDVFFKIMPNENGDVVTLDYIK